MQSIYCINCNTAFGLKPSNGEFLPLMYCIPCGEEEEKKEADEKDGQ